MMKTAMIYNSILIVVLSFYLSTFLVHNYPHLWIYNECTHQSQKNVPLIHKIFINILFGFDVYIPDCTVKCFKSGKHVMNILIIPDNI